MGRDQKIKLLTEVFHTGNKSLLAGTNKILIHSVVIERDGWMQVIAIEPDFEVSEEMTFEQFQNWKGSLPLFPDISNFDKERIV